MVSVFLNFYVYFLHECRLEVWCWRIEEMRWERVRREVIPLQVILQPESVVSGSLLGGQVSSLSLLLVPKCSHYQDIPSI